MIDTPLRSVLFLPASSARAVEKARTLDCDAVILDLEDAVAPDAKVEAREAMVEALSAGGFRAPVVAVRVNGLDTPWGVDDLAAAARAGASVVVAPKVADAANLKACREALPREARLWANIETCEGVLNVRYIANAAGEAGCDAFVFGQNDLSKDMGLRPGRDRRPLHAAMSLTVMAARSRGLAAIDGVFNDFGDVAGFEDECVEGRA
ncbi:MAG TPA: CoA ester lyase, partial [Caulobacteraceae bacterium]|nr:CoA ester lyase [Caulobacteraceae bacterium]